MTKTLFDGIATQSINNIVNHGGAEYAKFVLNGALEAGYQFDIVFDRNKTNDPEVMQLLEQHSNINIFYVSSQEDLYRLINEKDYVKFYSALPYRHRYIDSYCKTRLVGVIHGLRNIELEIDKYQYRFFKSFSKSIIYYILYNLKFAHNFVKKHYIKNMQKLLNVKDAIFITVSQHSKFSILNFYPDIKSDNILVFYSPFEVKAYEKSVCNKDYYLLVSANRFGKNTFRAIESFDRLFSNGRLDGKHVVITGCDDINFSKYIKNKDRFKLLPYVSSEELDDLFKSAFCFVYPSLNEGFGYPPLKAMSYRVPVIASSSTSIPEVCQDAAVMFSPLSCDDLCNRILQIDIDDSLRAKCIEKGDARVAELQQLQQDTFGKMLEYVFN